MSEHTAIPTSVMQLGSGTAVSVLPPPESLPLASKFIRP